MKIDLRKKSVDLERVVKDDSGINPAVFIGSFDTAHKSAAT